MHSFGVVQAQRTSSNLLEPQHHRASKVWRGLSQEFGVVRLYRTFSSYLLAGETRCAGCLCTSSGWFKHSEPHRTYMSLGWFDCTEPSLGTLLQGKQGVQGATALGRGGSSTANLLEQQHHWFAVLEPPELVQKHPTHLATSVMVWFV